jgi:hypothetical protein
LEANLLPDLCVAKTFFQATDCFLSVLIMSFEVKKILILVNAVIAYFLAWLMYFFELGNESLCTVGP